MKPGFETQREVEQFFAGRNDEDSVWIREGLYSLISNVLFVADKKEEGKYHPRIGVQRDFVFRSLNEEREKMRLTDYTTSIIITGTTSSGINRL